jgi:hypothetical protein
MPRSWPTLTPSSPPAAVCGGPARDRNRGARLPAGHYGVDGTCLQSAGIRPHRQRSPFHLPLYTPVTCVDVADRIRPGTARHVGRIPAVELVNLTYSAVLDLRERTPRTALDIAPVVSLAHPSPDWSAGLVVATAQPDLYAGLDLPIYPVGD